MNPVLVSAFIYDEKHYQDLDFYISQGNKLLTLDFNKVIFIDERINHHFEKHINDRNIFIKVRESDLYLYEYIDKLENKTNGNPEKDTNKFFAIMCNKTEWVRQAIEMNHFNTEHYVWIDFGIFKIFDTNIMIQKLNNKYNAIRIGSIWDIGTEKNKNLEKEICWYFAGGIFGGHKQKLLFFADAMKHETLNFIKKNNYLIWEVNLWYIIYKKYGSLFSVYNCNHNISIINNY
jgi:hypothetical protein